MEPAIYQSLAKRSYNNATATVYQSLTQSVRARQQKFEPKVFLIQFSMTGYKFLICHLVGVLNYASNKQIII